MAPSSRDLSSSGTISSGSTSMRVPMPEQSGQAPKGELKEKERGSSSSKDRSSYGQYRCSENMRSRSGSSSGRSTKSSTTMPPASPRAVSTESVRRRLADSFTVRRSMTTSMVCFSCFFSVGGSDSWIGLAVHARAAVALGLEIGEQVDELALALAHQRRQHLEAAALRQLQDPVDDGLRRLARDRAAALGAVRLADAREEQTQVVVDLGDGADRRARVARGRLLVDRDRRATGPR